MPNIAVNSSRSQRHDVKGSVIMAKFAKNVKTRANSPVRASEGLTRTYEGGTAYSRDAKSDLFLLAVTNMVREDTFYESAKNRDDRFKNLIHQVAQEDRDFIAGFTLFLRNEMNMRSASIVMAAEAVAGGVERGRQIVNSSIVRADEPAEMLGYWFQTYGRKIPQPVKRGVADAVKRLYTERNALKYDGLSRSIRMADVIELVHPSPRDNQQSDLFRYLIDRRHNRADGDYDLQMINRVREFELQSVDTQRAAILSNPEILNEMGYTWERLSGLGKMDAAAWEAIIPHMGYMALLRNLRNFEQNKVSVIYMNQIAEKLANSEEVTRSRQFPYRMLSAYLASGTTFFVHALETALDLSTQNVPQFRGKTLVLVDTSGSMMSTLSSRSVVQRAQVGYLFGAAVAKKSDAKLIQFATGSKEVRMSQGTSVLRLLEHINYGEVGHGTNLLQALTANMEKGVERVIVFSDMQGTYFSGQIPAQIPVYLFNLAGYAPSILQSGTGNVHEIGGFSDAAFKMIDLLECGRDSKFPWEN